MWDERYSKPEFAYGTEPNEFLVSVVDKLPSGCVLCLCEGEGRNAVYLARKGYKVLAVDSSRVGIEKAKQLAATENVQIEATVTDLKDFRIKPDAWDAIVSIFCHIPSTLRREVHQAVVKGLKKNGAFVLEAYTPQQIKYSTGGPKDEDLTVNLDKLREELEGLDLELAREIERDVMEGAYHTGTGAVVQILGYKR